MDLLTRQCVLDRLLLLFVEALGLDDDEADFSADDNLIDWLLKLGFQIYMAGDLGYFCYRRLCENGLTATADEFSGFFYKGVEDPEEWEQTVKPTLTFARFADWIIENTHIPSYEAVNITGTVCQPAGTFLGIQDVVQRVAPQVSPFGPSTPIRSTLKNSELDRIWNLLQFHCKENLPSLFFTYTITGCSLMVSGIFFGFVFLAIWGESDLIENFLTVLIAMALFASGIKLLNYGNPLPDNIVTFKDLTLEMTRALERSRVA